MMSDEQQPYPDVPWYQSRTIIAGLIAAIFGILSMFGVKLPFDQPLVVETLLTVVGLFVVWNRVVSKNSSNITL